MGHILLKRRSDITINIQFIEPEFYSDRSRTNYYYGGLEHEQNSVSDVVVGASVSVDVEVVKVFLPAPWIVRVEAELGELVQSLRLALQHGLTALGLSESFSLIRQLDEGLLEINDVNVVQGIVTHKGGEIRSKSGVHCVAVVFADNSAAASAWDGSINARGFHVQQFTSDELMRSKRP